MISIRELNVEDTVKVKEIAVLHKRAFPHFFLTQLGIPFLKSLYQGYLEDNESGIIIAEDDERIYGFIAYSKDYSRLYRELIRNHLFRFGFCSVGASLRHPSFIRRILGAFKKSESVKKEEKYVELASICVDPQAEGKGIGTRLINYLIDAVDFSVYSYINLETDAVDNDAVNRFYMKNGFILARQYITGEGRRMNEYRYTAGVAT